MTDQIRPLAAIKGMQPDAYFGSLAQQNLLIAAFNEQWNAAEFAIKQGADVNIVGTEGMTPLIWSVINGETDAVKFLLNHGAQPDAVTTWKNRRDAKEFANATNIAAIMDTSAVLRVLLEGGANPNIVEDPRTQRTPIFQAILHDRTANIDLLVEYSADINYLDISKSTPINYAVSMKKFSIALHLLDLNADPNIKDRWGYSAVDTVRRFKARGLPKGSEDEIAYHKFVELLLSNELLEK